MLTWVNISVSVIVSHFKAVVSGDIVESFHVVYKRVHQVVSVFLHVDEFEVKASTLVRQMCQVLPQSTTLSSVQLSVSAFLNEKYRLLPLFAIK